jgi:hypothetical protein
MALLGGEESLQPRIKPALRTSFQLCTVQRHSECENQQPDGEYGRRESAFHGRSVCDG